MKSLALVTKELFGERIYLVCRGELNWRLEKRENVSARENATTVGRTQRHFGDRARIMAGTDSQFHLFF